MNVSLTPEEKRESYKPEINANNVKKLIRFGNLESGETFLRNDDIFMVTNCEIFQYTSYDHVKIASRKAISLSTGYVFQIPIKELVLPVKATITIN